MVVINLYNHLSYGQSQLILCDDTRISSCYSLQIRCLQLSKETVAVVFTNKPIVTHPYAVFDGNAYQSEKRWNSTEKYSQLDRRDLFTEC